MPCHSYVVFQTVDGPEARRSDGHKGTEFLENRFRAMSAEEPELYDEPTKVDAKNGEVILDGPDGVDVKLTPEAARETSVRLWDGAAKAKVQTKHK